MAAYPPPIFVQYLVERAAPGFWGIFVGEANAAMEGLDVVVTSWWRGKQRNLMVGGAPDSQHQLGAAIDVSGRDWRRAAQRLRARGFVVVEYSGHAHAQAWPKGVARRAGLLDAIGA